MRKTIEKIVGYAAQIAEPDKVILFGSLANGTYNVHSDLDLLIISDTPYKRQISEQIAQFARDLSLKADVLVYSQTELDNAFEKPTSFLAGIYKTGKIVYRKDEKSL